jgi:hypothetical protein
VGQASTDQGVPKDLLSQGGPVQASDHTAHCIGVDSCAEASHRVPECNRGNSTATM